MVKMVKYKKNERDEMNISLIGVPTSGKTTIGKRLAKKLGKVFFDLDEEVEKVLGVDIGERMREDIKNTSIREAYLKMTRVFTKTYEHLNIGDNRIIATGALFGSYYVFKGKEQVFFLKISKVLYLRNVEFEKQYPTHPNNRRRKFIIQKQKSIISSFEYYNFKMSNKDVTIIEIKNRRDFIDAVENIERELEKI